MTTEDQRRPWRRLAIVALTILILLILAFGVILLVNLPVTSKKLTTDIESVTHSPTPPPTYVGGG